MSFHRKCVSNDKYNCKKVTVKILGKGKKGGGVHNQFLRWSVSRQVR